MLMLGDLYSMRLNNNNPDAIPPIVNHSVEVESELTNAVVDANSLPEVFAEAEVGLMGGGSIFPYPQERDPVNPSTGLSTLWESHSAAGINVDRFERRDFRSVGITYLWDTPATTYLRVLDDAGGAIQFGEVKLYQKHWLSGVIDNVPEITGETDINGIL